MKKFNLVTLEEGISKLHIKFKDTVAQTQTLSIFDCLNKYLAKDIKGICDIPEFNRSTVDGYAIINKDLKENNSFKLAFSVPMGKKCETLLKENETAYVPTGGMLPTNADTMVMLEDCDVLKDIVTINNEHIKHQNIIFSGDDCKKDETLLTKGIKITPFHVGLLASAGIFEIEVYKTIKCSIISTGDELVNYDEAQEVGQIREINGLIIEKMLNNADCEVVYKDIIKDDYEKIKNAIAKALEESDIVILSGGSSVGEKDYTYEVIQSFENSDIFIHGLALKPGKPTIVAKVGDKAVFGLPGHPVSAIVVFDLMVNLYLDIIRGVREKKILKAKLTENAYPDPKRFTCLPVTISVENDELLATPVNGKSGLISLLKDAKGYIKIDNTLECISKDSEVFVHLF